jgi:hypothetical protein
MWWVFVDTVLCWRPLTFCVGKNGVGASFWREGGMDFEIPETVLNLCPALSVRLCFNAFFVCGRSGLKVKHANSIRGGSLGL